MNGTVPRRVVCAALQNSAGDIICGARHFDAIMRRQIEVAPTRDWKLAQQGFIDQWGAFLTREEAYAIAKKNNQIIFKCGNEGGTELFSEHLY